MPGRGIRLKRVWTDAKTQGKEQIERKLEKERNYVIDKRKAEIGGKGREKYKQEAEEEIKRRNSWMNERERKRRERDWSISSFLLQILLSSSL